MAYEITLLTTISIAILFALSLNVITGFCGQASLGHAAFYGLGAYTAALLTKAGMPLVLALFPAAAVAGLAGLLVGVASLRVRHDFLAITTMGVTFLFVGIVRKQDILGGEIESAVSRKSCWADPACWGWHWSRCWHLQSLRSTSAGPGWDLPLTR